MSPSNACPHPAELQKLIAGHLAPGEQAELSRHLDSCANCQALLEHLTGGRESWHDIARQLGQPRAAIDPALANAMDRLQVEPGRQETAAERWGKDDGSLDFLDPPTKPGHIGRLDDYEILGVVGRGGMGVVLKAYDPALHRVVAIKVMAPQLASSSAARQRFKREVKAAAPLNNDYVVTIHAVAETKGLPYIVMQYIDGRSLQERIDQCGALELKEILRIGMQAATGLAAAHAQGLVHRDIKPGNILLENGVERVKITDFGLARSGDDARVTQTGVVTGTPQYMAPEQARGEALDHRADFFSLGGVLYAMCTGYAPFRASSSMAVLKKVCEDTPRPIRELNPDIPVWLPGIVEKLMAKNAEDRFESAKEVADLLGQHLAHLQQPARVPSPPRVEPPRAEAWAGIRTRRPSLVLPILLLIAPFTLVPLLVIASRFLDPGLGFIPPRWIAIILGVGCLFLGVVLLVVQLARRASAGKSSVLQPSQPRSRAWVAVLVAGIVFIALLFCLVPVGLVLFYWGFSHTDVVPRQHIIDGVELSGNENVTGPADASKLGRYEPEEGIQNNDYVLDGLRWFPEECTFGATYSYPSALPEIGDRLWTLAWTQSGPGSPGTEVMTALGGATMLSRVAYAYAEDPEGKRSRHFLQISGLWNRAQVIAALSKRTGAKIEEHPEPVAGHRVTLILRDEYAIAVAGSESILVAGYDGKATAHEHANVVRLALAAKEADSTSKKGTLLAGPLGAELRKVPHRGFCVLGGDLPKDLRELLKQAGFPVLPRSAVIALAKGNDDSVVLSFHATLANAAEGDQLVLTTAGWPQQIHASLDRELATQTKPASEELLNQLRSTPPLVFEVKHLGAGTLEGRVRVPKGVWRAALAAAEAAASARPRP